MSWQRAASDLTMTVACEGAQHHLRWHNGEVQLIDHPELEAELALVAFGGAEPACLSLRRLWNDGLADGGFLAEWVDEVRMSPTWFSWLAMALERMRSEGFHEFLRSLPPARAQRMGEFLHRFPVPWIDRAAASVGESVFDGDGVICLDAVRLLPVAVSHRLRRAFVDSVGGSHLSVGAAALVPLTLTVSDGTVDDGDANATGINGSITGRGRGVQITVDGSWLHRVWAANAAVIDGQLTLSLDYPHPSQPQEPSRTIEAVAESVCWAPSDGPGLQPIVERCVVSLHEGRWHRV
ncbi:MAG: hypothetical protein ACRBK7_16450 [Acidimicrobiales bacterium]